MSRCNLVNKLLNELKLASKEFKEAQGYLRLRKDGDVATRAFKRGIRRIDKGVIEAMEKINCGNGCNNCKHYVKDRREADGD